MRSNRIHARLADLALTGLIATVLLGGLLAPAGAALAQSAPSRAASSPAADQPLAIVASFSLLADFTRQVVGERGRVTMLVPPGGDAHVYQPGPEAARALAGARLVVVNGLGFEGWMDRLVSASGYRGPVLVASDGIEPMRALTAHRHDHDHAHDAARRPAGSTAAGAGAGSPALDPHAWQSVPNVRRYIDNIARALCRIDPAGCPDYRHNADRYLGELQRLDDEIRAAIATVPAQRRRVLVSHDAFAYYGREYGLFFISPVGVSTGAEPSAATVGRLIREIRQLDVQAVFIENISDPRLVRRIGAETGASRGGRLYSDGLTDGKGGAVDYLTMMRANTRELVEALRAAPKPAR